MSSASGKRLAGSPDLERRPEAFVPYPAFVACAGSGHFHLGRDSLARGIALSGGPSSFAPWADPLVRDLIEKGLLIDAVPVETSSAGVLLEHPRLVRPTFPFEWSAEMLRDAARASLDVAAVMARAGCLPSRIHAWNVCFRHTAPMLIDYGAFAPEPIEEPPGPSLEELFESSFVRPLELMSAGYGSLARTLFMERIGFEARETPPATGRGVLARVFEDCMGRRVSGRLRRLARGVRGGARAIASRRPDSLPARIDWMRRRLESVRLESAPSLWSRYYRGRDVDPADSPLEAKTRAVERAISAIDYGDVVDIGCNRGFYGLAFARRGHHLVAIDSDERCVSDLYSIAKRESLPVTPVVMSVTSPSPTPAHPNGRLLSVSERLSGDLVLVLAVMHHLTLGQGLDFVSLAEMFSLFCRRYLLMEFVEPADRTLQRSGRPIPHWYGEEGLTRAFSRRFRLIGRTPSASPTRTLMLFEKISP